MFKVFWRAKRGPLIRGVPKHPDATELSPADDRWTPNPDAILPDEMWWPTANAWVPSPDRNPLYPATVEAWVESPLRPAVIGRSARIQPSRDDAFWMKLTDEPFMSDFSVLLVDDGIHRSIATVLDGERWIRATMQAAPMVHFEGGLPIEA